jgi:hypothetical protein
MSKRGRMIYVPVVVFDELDDIMHEEGLNRRAEAFDKLTTYSKLGREVKKKAHFERVTLRDVFGGSSKKKNYQVNDSTFEDLI